MNERNPFTHRRKFQPFNSLLPPFSYSTSPISSPSNLFPSTNFPIVERKKKIVKTQLTIRRESMDILEEGPDLILVELLRDHHAYSNFILHGSTATTINPIVSDLNSSPIRPEQDDVFYSALEGIPETPEPEEELELEEGFEFTPQRQRQRRYSTPTLYTSLRPLPPYPLSPSPSQNILPLMPSSPPRNLRFYSKREMNLNDDDNVVEERKKLPRGTIVTADFCQSLVGDNLFVYEP